LKAEKLKVCKRRDLLRFCAFQFSAFRPKKSACLKQQQRVSSAQKFASFCAPCVTMPSHNFIAAMTGAAIMIIEILGVKMLAPYKEVQSC